MSSGPRFPKHPFAGHGQEFVGPDGKNPFSDDGRPPEAAAATAASGNAGSENLFAAPVATNEPNPQVQFETMLPHRGRQMLRIGLIGFGGSLFTTLVIGPMVFWVMNDVTGLVLIVTTAAVAISIVAFFMARADLRAMALGAMDRSGEAQTLRGKRFAALGIAVGLMSWAGVAGWIALSILQSM